MENGLGLVLHSWVLEDRDGTLHRVDAVEDEDARISDFREPGMANATTMALFDACVGSDPRGVRYLDDGVTAHDADGFLADMCAREVDDACACAYARRNRGSWAVVDSRAAGGPVAVSLTGYDDDRIYPGREDALGSHDDAAELPDGRWVGLDAGDEVWETAGGEGAMAERVRRVSGDDPDEAEALLEAAGVAVSRIPRGDGVVVALRRDVLERFDGATWRGPDGRAVPVTEDNWREAASSVISEELGVVAGVADGDVLGLVHLSPSDPAEVDGDDPWATGWSVDDQVWGCLCGSPEDALESARYQFGLESARVVDERSAY